MPLPINIPVLHLLVSLCLLTPLLTVAFTAKAPAINLNDRFKATCPVDLSVISQFDPRLLENSDDEDCTWVAVFRSSNNLPSVLIKDDFLNAMRIATTVQTDSTTTEIDDSAISDQIEKTDAKSNVDDQSVGVKAQTPVAVGRLSRSRDFPDAFKIDKLQCSLKKEDTNESCDGNSEHLEAISICVDELILHHLKEGRLFDNGTQDGAIRMKGTIHQDRLLENRGFVEVQTLSRDMATHISNLDLATTKYAERVVDTVSKCPGARDRALKILNYLGKQEPVISVAKDDDSKDDDEYDPWAGKTIRL